MKTKLIIILMALITIQLHAEYAENIPVEVKQPDGTVLKLLTSGDEFYNYLHDDKGYTIVQADDGYYYYGIEANGLLVPSKYRYGAADPVRLNLKKGARISKVEYNRKRFTFNNKDYRFGHCPSVGNINNLVVFIKFKSGDGFDSIFSKIDTIYNSATKQSLKNYFAEVSYNKLNISSSFYPGNINPTTLAPLSYTDPHPRAYYQAYDATANPEGYKDKNTRWSREHELVENAVSFIKNILPANLNIDIDNNGQVDNIVIIIQGSRDSGKDIFWSHRSQLDSKTVYLKPGKKIWDYIIIPEDRCTRAFTICHEFFHAIGAPDLDHTNDFSNPVGAADVMSEGFVHPGAYMKWKYSRNEWITDIPTISVSRKYTLYPLTSSKDIKAYRINSSKTEDEYFVLEVRDRTYGLYETNLPGSGGLLVYKINPNFRGNTNNSDSCEVYIYRPDGTIFEDSVYNGNLLGIFYPVGAKNFIDYSAASNPKAWIYNNHGGVTDGGLSITNITKNADGSVSFIVNFKPIVFISGATSVTQTSAVLNGKVNAQGLATSIKFAIWGDMLPYTEYQANPETITGNTTIKVSKSLSNLKPGRTYYYKIIATNSQGKTISSESVKFITPLNYAGIPIPYSYGFDSFFQTGWTHETFPTNGNARWSWGITSGTHPNCTPYSGIGMAMFNSYEATSGYQAALTSPQISLYNLSSATLRIRVFLDNGYQSKNDLIQVQIKESGGNWIHLLSIYRYNAITDWKQHTINLTPYINKSVQIRFIGVSAFGNNIYMDDMQITGQASTEMDITEEITEIENIAQLQQNYPNPFSSNTRIDYAIPQSCTSAIITMYNIYGNLCKSHIINHKGKGNLNINKDEFSSGMYYYSLIIDGQVIATKKMIIN